MTVKDYLDNNSPFYHITPSSNMESIINNGLKWKNGGICVVRSNEPEIWREIINGQLAYPDQYYDIIKICPLNIRFKYLR